MKEVDESELAEIGGNAAPHIAGLGTVERVQVRTGLDSTDRPAYFFSFIIEQGRDRQQAGLSFTRLSQRLRDELMARDDDHYPYVQIMNRAGWERLEAAVLV